MNIFPSAGLTCCRYLVKDHIQLFSEISLMKNWEKKTFCFLVKHLWLSGSGYILTTSNITIIRIISDTIDPFCTQDVRSGSILDMIFNSVKYDVLYVVLNFKSTIQYDGVSIKLIFLFFFYPDRPRHSPTHHIRHSWACIVLVYSRHCLVNVVNLYQYLSS